MSSKVFRRNFFRTDHAVKLVLLPLGLMLLFVTSSLGARDVPSTLTFQATLSQEDGTTFSCQQPNCITFRLFEQLERGEAIWEETQGPFNVRNGSFSVRLGRNEPLSDLPFDTIYFLELQVGDAVLSPRLELSTVPYSITSTRVTPGSIRRESIAEGAVDRERIAPGAVDRDRIQPGAVDRERIAPGAVDRDRITPGAVSQDRLAERAVGRGQMEDRAVGRDQLELGAVGREQIAADPDAEPGSVLSFDGTEVRWVPPGAPAPGSVTEQSIAAGAVTREKIAPQAVDRDRITPGAVSQDRLAERAVGRGQMEHRAVGRQQLDERAVGRQQIDDRAVGRGQLELGAVGREQLEPGAVSLTEISPEGAAPGQVLAFDGNEVVWAPPAGIADGSIVTAMLADDSVTSAKLAEAAVESSRIANEAVTGAKIAVGAIDSTRIAAGAVGSTQLAPDAVSTAQITDQSVTREKINTAGAAEGAVLRIVEGFLQWVQPPGAEGLELPTARDLDSGNVNAPEPAFRIRHYGGEALVGIAGAGPQGNMLTGVRGEARVPIWEQNFTVTEPEVSHGVLGRSLIGPVRIGLYGIATDDGLGEFFQGDGIHPEEAGSPFHRGIGVVGEGRSDGVFGVGYANLSSGVSGVGRLYGVSGHVYSPAESPPGFHTAGVGGFGEQFGVLGHSGNESSVDWFLSPQELNFLTNGRAAVVGVKGPEAPDAGLFLGNVRVTSNLTVGGNIQKSGGSFRIDHPLDPANKWLYHSFVESPDMMNVYNGNIELDENGEAMVKLPDYFEALNSDFRYQLTAIGAPGPYLHIAEEIQDNQFRIAGGLAGSRVSWQVTGIRRDLWAEENRIPVETLKAPEERGHYYGQQ